MKERIRVFYGRDSANADRERTGQYGGNPAASADDIEGGLRGNGNCFLVDDEVTMIQIMEKAIDWKKERIQKVLWLIMRMQSKGYPGVVCD